MSKITFKPLVANKPGHDTRSKKTEPEKAKVEAVPYKKAIMGRSNLPSRVGSAKRDVHLA